MASEVTRATARGAITLHLDDHVVRALREQLPEVATRTVAAVTAEVPGYTGALSGPMGANIEAAVQMALAGFLKLAAGARDADPSTPVGPTLDGAYDLGRGEARNGRTMDALLAAYRVGARVAWRELAAPAARAGVEATTMAQFAELVFAYIDELSAASAAGHTDELSTSGRVRERYRERLGQHLLAGAREDLLVAAAERADWPLPTTLTAVLVSPAQVRGVLASLGPDTLVVGEDLPGAGPLSLLLVPEVDGTGRQHLIRVLTGRQAVVGPPRPWPRARLSYDRAARAATLFTTPTSDGRPVDSEDHLAELVITADPDALHDLRARVLAPLNGMRPATRERLEATLRSWLLHQGRRDAVAAELHVHPQTVRYRMGQLRDLYGDQLDAPTTVFDLLLALPNVRTSDR
ncbi:PucR family transcriptional regulator [Actinophytocola sp.]|uniref:PucR family transcriptional regulator n=1 Tax=Actinophytocola sp. TaxID=1872138 RepID=UPI003899FC56